MIQFRYKLKIDERVKATCPRHARYNFERDGRGGIRGQCSGCFALFDLYQARIELDRAVRDFQRRAAPWARPRSPRKRKLQDPAPAAPEEAETPERSLPAYCSPMSFYGDLVARRRRRHSLKWFGTFVLSY
jgi:hypothetical protein